MHNHTSPSHERRPLGNVAGTFFWSNRLRNLVVGHVTKAYSFPIQVNKYLLRFIECWLQFLDCVAEDEKDEFEITSHPQGSEIKDNFEKERDFHLSSAVNSLGGPRQLTLSVWGCFP